MFSSSQICQQSDLIAVFNTSTPADTTLTTPSRIRQCPSSVIVDHIFILKSKVQQAESQVVKENYDP